MRTVMRVCLLLLAVGMFLAAILYAVTGSVTGSLLYLAGGLLAFAFERVLEAG